MSSGNPTLPDTTGRSQDTKTHVYMEEHFMTDFFRVWKTEDVLKRILPPALLAFSVGYILGRFRILYLLTE